MTMVAWLIENQTLSISIYILFVALLIGIIITCGCICTKRNQSRNGHRAIPDTDLDTEAENEFYESQSQFHPKQNTHYGRRLAILTSLIVCSVISFGFFGWAAGVYLTYCAAAQNVLPNARLNVLFQNSTELRGDITFKRRAKSIEFQWISIKNDNDALIEFICTDIDAYTAYSDVLNGFNGFQMNINNLAKPNTTINVAMNLLLFKINKQEPTVINITPNFGLTTAQEKTLMRMFNGYIGEYFTQLSIKLGAIGYVGQQYKVVNSIHQFGSTIGSLVKKGDQSKNKWRWRKINKAVNIANEELAKYRTERRKLQSSCSTDYWWKLGDGECDAGIGLNSAACNWDNGDCCQHTCGDAINWEDNDKKHYNGYKCYGESGSDPYCRNGIKNGNTCCKSTCDQCTGAGCGDGDGSNVNNCCGGPIQDSGISCDNNVAPCIINPSYSESGADPYCRNGIKNGNVCCKSTCDQCTGAGCGDGGGSNVNNCCGGPIQDSGISCDYNVAPCIINSEPWCPPFVTDSNCNCDNSLLGNGQCDTESDCNSEQCLYDLGDCCADTCIDGVTYKCGSNGYQCKDPAPNYCSRVKPGCDNQCMGLCGPDCTCWVWACGNCRCNGDCSEHDTYCSCDGAVFWCLNPFWITCDNGNMPGKTLCPF